MKKFLVVFGFNLAFLIILLIALEVWVGADYRKRFPDVDRPIQVLYPPNPINGFEDPEFSREIPPDEFRILCLGASTSKWSNYPAFIAWAFQGLPWMQEKKLKVKAYSTGFEAHTSLDSYYKYKYLYEGYDFDLIVVYHGINELRANNCPPEMFQDDYSHFSYYSILNRVVRLMDIPVLNRSFLAFKVVLKWGEFIRKRIEKLNPQSFVPTHEPLQGWLEYGKDVRSADVFRGNLENILELAKERSQMVLLMTFAYVIPEGYSQESFKAGALGYGCEMDIGVPVELYGRSENVRKGLEIHNGVMLDMAEEYECYFVDQAELMDENLDYFIDVCHFSREGITQFAVNIARYFLGREIR